MILSEFKQVEDQIPVQQKFEIIFLLIQTQQNTLYLQSFNFISYMSSFTPFFDPSIQMFPTNFLPWLHLNAWNSNNFMLFPLKKKQFSEDKDSPLLIGQKKPISTAQCSPIQDQYQPEREIEAFDIQERKSGGRIQCKGRNDYSNILKAFIHLIKTHPVLKQKIKGIITSRSLTLTYQRFLMRIRRKFSKGKTYISPKEILNFIKSCNDTNDQSQKAIGLLFRIILKQFLSIEYVLSLIKSFKGKKQSRKDLIMKTRQLMKLIFEEQCLIDSN